MSLCACACVGMRQEGGRGHACLHVCIYFYARMCVYVLEGVLVPLHVRDSVHECVSVQLNKCAYMRAFAC